MPAGRLHRHRRDDLHEVVDDDVAQRADRVVEVAAVVDAEVLGHRDLHARDVVAVPDRLEDRVGEAQIEDLGEAHLAEEVVDPVELLLVAGARASSAFSARADARSWPNGFSTTTRACSVRPAPARPLITMPNSDRRDLEVEDRAAAAPSSAAATRPNVAGSAKSPLKVGEAGGEAVEDRLVERLAAASIAARACARRSSSRPVVDRDADDRALQQAAALEAVQRVEGHLFARSPLMPKTTRTSVVLGAGRVVPGRV